MSDAEEAAWVLGRRAGWVSILQQAIRELGYKDETGAAAAWIAERESIVAALRGVCEDHGDNDWQDDLDLTDVIEKHLAPYLDEACEESLAAACSMVAPPEILEALHRVWGNTAEEEAAAVRYAIDKLTPQTAAAAKR